MKRPSSSEALVGAVGGGGRGSFPMCLSGSEEKDLYRGRVGSFQSILEGMGEEEEEMMGDGDELGAAGIVGSMSPAEKKRRLSVEQVKALEKNFELENKLEPERKVKLAQELGLQPRQVAVWFQNRRARWKTKQLERDFGLLKTDYDALKHNFDALQQDKDALLAEIKGLKAKLAADGESYCSIKVEPFASEEQEESEKNTNVATKVVAEEEEEENDLEEEEEAAAPTLIYKDGSSDSDSSAVLNDESGGISSPSGVLSHDHHQQLQDQEQQQQTLFMDISCSSPSSSPFQCLDGRNNRVSCYYYYDQQQLLTEEDDFLSGEDPCSSSIFSDEQHPTLSWYYSDQWN